MYGIRPHSTYCHICLIDNEFIRNLFCAVRAVSNKNEQIESAISTSTRQLIDDNEKMILQVNCFAAIDIAK